ncbi:MAG: hypothetical protein FD146_725 [Anaerolineaceae bacterium]|nr:MAG: hypothetical protein FD146_725 [Anaerolineaceae bacterium]
MKNIGKWLYFLGLLVAVITALIGFQALWLSLILLLIGIFVAIFYFDSNDIIHIGIRYLVLAAVYNVLDAIPFLGPYLTTIFGAVFMFLGPVVLTVLVVWFVKKYFLGKE